jgi:hypothetical protein
MAHSNIIIQRGSRYIAVADYGCRGGIGRQGYWCADKKGGWGVSSKNAYAAIDQCVMPITYRSIKKAREALEAY